MSSHRGWCVTRRRTVEVCKQSEFQSRWRRRTLLCPCLLGLTPGLPFPLPISCCQYAGPHRRCPNLETGWEKQRWDLRHTPFPLQALKPCSCLSYFSPVQEEVSAETQGKHSEPSIAFQHFRDKQACDCFSSNSFLLYFTKVLAHNVFSERCGGTKLVLRYG